MIDSRKNFYVFLFAMTEVHPASPQALRAVSLLAKTPPTTLAGSIPADLVAGVNYSLRDMYENKFIRVNSPGEFPLWRMDTGECRVYAGIFTSYGKFYFVYKEFVGLVNVNTEVFLVRFRDGEWSATEKVSPSVFTG